jgi:hypothetical protein
VLKTVASFREPYEAQLVRGKLEAEGIPAIVQDEHLVQMNWTYSQAIGGVKVQVPEEALERARQILVEGQGVEFGTTEDSVEEPDEEDICPKCGSSSTFPRPYSLSSIALSIIYCLPIFWRKEGKVCRNCGTAWRMK